MKRWSGLRVAVMLALLAAAASGCASKPSGGYYSPDPGLSGAGGN